MNGAEVLTQRLSRLKALRRERRLDAERDRRLRRLTEWQGHRLARTHGDLLASERYRPAIRFFLDDLYAPKDFSQRDRDLMKLSPMLARVLPESSLHTVGLAIEMNVLTEELDAATDAALVAMEPPAGDETLTEERYAEAYRRAGDGAKRRRQIELIREVGEDLDHIVRRPWLKSALAMARGPARMSGLDDLHGLLVRGHEAFSHMRGAGEFLEAICGRELAIMERVFEGHPEPFAVEGC